MSLSFFVESYALHAAEVVARRVDVPNIIGRPDSIDSWRHLRMYAHLRPLLESESDAAWLTVGDSGADAYYLGRAGARAVTATCISDAALQSLARQGHLARSDVRAENAESIAMSSDCVDFVLCKEAYHHFPRPPIAFYEMLRVCRRGVVLIEPVEARPARPLDIAKRFAKRLFRNESPEHQLFEDSGNYIFRLSCTEVGKMAAALQLASVAERHFNDFYSFGIAARNQSERWPMLVQKLGISVQDLCCRLGLMSWGLAAVIVFKTPPDQRTLAALRRHGFTVRQVPINPRVARG